MAVTRADALTGTSKQKEYYSDFLTSFDMTPYGKQLARVTNEQAVNQSLKNLIKTNLSERLFQPFVGSDIYAMLFEINDSQSFDMVEMAIENTIKNNEPRVNLLGVQLKDFSEENSVEISIYYTLINNPEPITLNILLKRVR